MYYVLDFISLNYTALLILVGAAVILYANRSMHIRGTRLAGAILILVLILLLLNYLEYWTETYHHGVVWNYIKTSGIYCIYPLLPLLETFLVAKHSKTYSVLLIVPYILFCFFEIADLFGAGITYYFLKPHIFQAGFLRPLPILMSCFYLSVFTVESLQLIKNGRRFQSIIVLFFALTMLLTAFLEYENIVTNRLGEVIAFEMIVYTVYLVALDYNDTRAELHQKDIELEKSKLTLMLSQIKPHFINNSLLAIRELCYEDPERAAELIDHFSAYLRNNLSATDSGRLVPFTEELNAVREYIALEYADETKQFQVEYDLRFTDFMLPALSVEPLVENALKHGVDRYSPDARVRIVSYAAEGSVIIEIRDNGSGFEENAETFGKNSIGLKNTESRLKLMCSGTLTVAREDGWTVVTIRIPDERSNTTCIPLQ